MQKYVLDIVVDELQRHAIRQGTHGILVTKTGRGHFTAELSEDAPYGVTANRYVFTLTDV